jgi:hypothetical protein
MDSKELTKLFAAKKELGMLSDIASMAVLSDEGVDNNPKCKEFLKMMHDQLTQWAPESTKRTIGEYLSEELERWGRIFI